MTDTTFVRRVGIGSVEALKSPFPFDVYIFRVNLWRDRSVCFAFGFENMTDPVACLFVLVHRFRLPVSGVQLR